MHKPALTTFWITVLALVGLPFTLASAQAQESGISGQLTYLKVLSDESNQYIQISAEGVTTLMVTQDQCSPISSSGNLIAVSSPQADIQLPYKAANEPVVTSPNNTWVIYNQCLDRNVDGQETVCRGESQIVVYNTQTQETVEVLKDANRSILGESQQNAGSGAPNPPSIFWSPSSRYILYASTGETPLKVYDVEQRQYTLVHLPPDMIFFAIDAGVQWTTDESQIGFWVFDAGGDTGPGLPQRLVIFDHTTGTTQASSVVAALKGSVNWVWSADNQAVALVNMNNTLLTVQVATGVSRVVDKGVYRVVSWH